MALAATLSRQLALGIAVLFLAGGCATLPPGMDAPKTASVALDAPETTGIGKVMAARAKAYPGLSGFRLLADGKDSFRLRLRIAQGAERTLDLQYFLLQQDDTGQLLLAALLDAADRGVRVRLLLDDAQAFETGSMIRPLAAHPNIEIRIYNPFVARQGFAFLRGAELLLGANRLNYRMHNKLFIGDNAIAVTGGRNIGDEYFQASSAVEFGDFDLAAGGPIVLALSRSFDQYWNDRLAVPVETLPLGKPSDADLARCREGLREHDLKMRASDYVRSLPAQDLLADVLYGRAPLVWARAVLAYDTPDKAQTTAGEQPGRLMWQRVVAAAEASTNELIIVSPYLVPGVAELELLRRLRAQGVRVRILTNSLASTDMPIVHAGYIRHRVPMLEAGIDLYEVRPVQGQPAAGSGHPRSGSASQFALHAKVFVIDRKRVFVGSMNFDQRSQRFNTEIGLIVDSAELAQEIAARFEAIAQPANSYQLALEGPADGGAKSLSWITAEGDKTLRFDADPGVDVLTRAQIRMLSLLPLDHLL